jgi:tetratricopeptide (TPR) repeat protein
MYPKGKAYAIKALELDDALAEAHCAFGTYYLLAEHKVELADKELQRAITLNANYPDVYHYYCHWFEVQGRPEEGIPQMEHGLELDPLSAIIGEELGWAYYHARRYEKAAQQLHKTIELDPAFLINYLTLAQVYEQMGRNQDAIATLHKLMTLPGGDWPEPLAELACAYAMSGNKAEAQKIIQQLNERSAREYINPYTLATIYVALGDKNRAFESLENAVSEGGAYMAFLKVEPKFDPVRSDPRFVDLLRRIGLN